MRFGRLVAKLEKYARAVSRRHKVLPSRCRKFGPKVMPPPSNSACAVSASPTRFTALKCTQGVVRRKKTYGPLFLPLFLPPGLEHARGTLKRRTFCSRTSAAAITFSRSLKPSSPKSFRASANRWDAMAAAPRGRGAAPALWRFPLRQLFGTFLTRTGAARGP